MDSSSYSSAASTNTAVAAVGVNNMNNRDHYLKHLNKLSHKISKPSTSAPPVIKTASFDNTQMLPPPQLQQQPQPSEPQSQNSDQSGLQGQAQQHQPPVYNINKNDFRDVVQKLTGSPAHERFSAPPPIHQPKPQSSRLKRIRPPPLAYVGNRPAASMMNCAVPNMNPPGCTQPTLPISGPVGSSFIQRPPAGTPLSPLPPFPTVHAAAESPVSSYLRYFRSSVSSTVDSVPKQISGFPPLAPLISPRWNNLTAPQQQPPPSPEQPHHQQQQPPQVSSTGINQSQLPSSSLPFGCLNSPRSPYPLLSPGSLFSPNSGHLGFPLSPTVPVPGPKWRGL